VTALSIPDPANSLAPTPAASAGTATLPALLAQSDAVLESLGTPFAPERRTLRQLAERLTAGRFHLAVLGQFKRGKSTLLNALLGEPVLPTSVVPATAIPTFLMAGDARGARVLFADERPPTVFTGGGEALTEFLSRYVTESGNPRNQRGVLQVEVPHPAPLLRRGVVLIDTPGIGSTFQHNTEATLNFPPQCDAAMFVVSADPPLTATEAGFLKEVRTKVPRLFFVLNKTDQLDAAEQASALAFLRRVLSEAAGVERAAPIFCVAARQALQSRRAADDARWASSGLVQVERYLLEFFAQEKTVALNAAIARRAAEALELSLMHLRLMIRSLELPLEELEKRLAVFGQKLRETEQQRLSSADLLEGDRKRLHVFLQEYAQDLNGRAGAYLEGVLDQYLAHGDEAARDVSEAGARDAVAEAIPGFFEHHLGVMTESFKTRIGEVLKPHRERADLLVGIIRQTAAELFDIPFIASGQAEEFELVRSPFWATRQWDAALNPITSRVLEGLMSARKRARRRRRRLLEQIKLLVMRNVENARWAIFQSINHKFYDFGQSLDQRLAETIAATQGAIQAALDKRQQHREAVGDETARLGRLADELGGLHAAFCLLCSPRNTPGVGLQGLENHAPKQ